jgi:hypothetical protein
VCRKRKKAPFYKCNQISEDRKTLGIVYHQHLLSDCRKPPHILMDDEIYITMNDSIKFTHSHYYAKDAKITSDRVKYAAVTKFPMKLGLWYAVSDCGISDWFIWRQGLAINSDIYKLHCIQRRLLPFVEKNICMVAVYSGETRHLLTTLHLFNDT